MNAPAQIPMWLPPPITAHDAAAIIGRLGGKARAEKLREPIRARTRQICRELNMPIPPALERVP